MAKSMQHRGPDAEGIALFNHQSTYVGLVHRRLSILDLDERSHQPMKNNDDTITVVYNGEIYNFKDIKSNLESEYEFNTTSDTEVIVAAYQVYGIEFVKKMIGIFSIAIYDHTMGKLFLIRDRHGVKPLYYYHNHHECVFASELRPIMNFDGFNPIIDKEAVQVMLAMKYIPAPKTIFMDVFKVKPGSVLTFHEGKLVNEWIYWDSAEEFVKTKKQKQQPEDYLHVLDKAVSGNLISDVGVATFLSGGIDSSLVSALAHKHKQNIMSYTIGFEEKEYDESPYAKEVAKALSINNKTFILNYDHMVEVALKLPEIYDEPFGDSSQIPTYLISKAVADDGVKVVLSGDGGDEFFYGYNFYDSAEKRQKKYRLLHPIAKVYHKLNHWHNYRLPGYGAYLMSDLTSYYYGLYSGFSGYYAYRAMRQKKLPSFFKQSFAFLNDLSSLDPREINSLFGQKIYMIDDIAVKVDRASMANGLESRVPLLDHPVSLKAYEATVNEHMKNKEKKYILKVVLEMFVPKALFNRKKQGFAVPLIKLLNEPKIKEKIFAFSQKDRLNQQNLFNYKMVQKILKKFYRYHDKNTTNFVWNYFVFQLWLTRT